MECKASQGSKEWQRYSWKCGQRRSFPSGDIEIKTWMKGENDLWKSPRKKCSVQKESVKTYWEGAYVKYPRITRPLDLRSWVTEKVVRSEIRKIGAHHSSLHEMSLCSFVQKGNMI